MTEPNCPNCNEDTLEWSGSDGVEWETYDCTNCGTTYEVPIEIERHWDDMKRTGVVDD